MHETRLSAVFKARPGLLSGSFLLSLDRLCQSAAKCDKHCELVGQRFFFILRESESQRESHSVRAIIVFDNYLYYLHLIIYIIYRSGSGAELQFMECLEWKDRILRELIQLICTCQEVQRAAELHKCQRPSVTRLIDTKSLLQVTPYHGDQTSFLGWTWSFLIAVRAISKQLYEGFKEIEDNINQDFRKSRLSTGDLELSDQAYTLLALLCKNEACAFVRSAEDGNGYQAWQALLRARTARNATNLLNQLLEPTFTSPDPRINFRQWNKNVEEYATRTGECVMVSERQFT